MNEKYHLISSFITLCEQSDNSENKPPKKKSAYLGLYKGAIIGGIGGAVGQHTLHKIGKSRGGEGKIKRGIKSVARFITPAKSTVGKWASSHSPGTSLRKLKGLPGIAAGVGALTVAGARLNRNRKIDKLKDKRSGL